MVQIGRELQQAPPKMSEQPSILNNILWSLKFRFYAWKQHQSIRWFTEFNSIFEFYDPKQTRELNTQLHWSVDDWFSQFICLSKTGRTNNVVLVHELLHGFGATDKYNLSNGEPIFPIGYAQADKQPSIHKLKLKLWGRIPFQSIKVKCQTI
jgi:hypothetical protein